MIQTLASTLPSGASSASAPAPTPLPAAEPAPPVPPPPQDSLDFSVIDTPLKASLLPILQPVVQANVVAGALIAALSGNPGMVFIDASILTGSNPVPQPRGSQIAISYIIDAKNDEQPLTESGIIGDRFGWNSLTVDEKSRTARFTGPHNYDDLTLSVNDREQALRLDGHLGSVETHLAITGKEGKKDEYTLRTVGTLGAEHYEMDSLIRGSDKKGDTIQGTMSVRGKLGAADIAKDYSLSITQNEKGTTITSQGGGNHAGVQESTEVHLRTGGDS